MNSENGSRAQVPHPNHRILPPAASFGCILKIEPRSKGKGFEFVNAIPPGRVPCP